MTEVWFDENVWGKIKEFAGYSNDYPTDLPYYVLMTGMNRNYCMTKMKWKSLERISILQKMKYIL